MQSKRSLYPRWSLAILLSAVLGVLGTNLPANAACTNPTPLPPGYASPCPVWSVSPASISQSGTETLTATPQPGTDYIYTTAYISQGTTWNPYILAGNNAAPNYSSALASLTLSSAQLSALSIGTHYTVVWDWLWDATAQCYKGPGLNQCNTGQWRVQSFTITITYAYSQSSYYAYSQAAYYAYSQSAYGSLPNGYYTTNFPLTENPISEGGVWTGGSAAGGNLWGDVQTNGTMAFGVSEPTQFGDPTAILKGTWAVDQTAQATVALKTAFTGTCCHEVELRLRMTVSSNSIRGYEAYCSVSSSNPYCHIARWNGLNGSYCNIESSAPSISLGNGDVIKATAAGTNPVVITMYRNGTQIMQASDTGQNCSLGGAAGPWTSGSPSIGFYDSQDSNWNLFGFSSFTASNTGSPYTYSQSTYYVYSQSSYVSYAYSQSAYTGNTMLSSGVLAPARAGFWQNVGSQGGAGLPAVLPTGETTPNPWTPPVRTQCGSTVTNTGITAAQINSLLAACPSGTYLLLAGTPQSPVTFNNLTGGTAISLGVKNGVTLRGGGADATKLACPSGCAGIAYSPPGGGQSNGNWTAGYAQGTTAITLSGAPPVNAEITLQASATITDTGGVWVCQAAGVCSESGGVNAQYETHIVKQVAGSGPYTITISPPIAFPFNVLVANGQPTANWASSPGYGAGLEDLTLDLTGNTYGFVMSYTNSSWAKGVRIINGGNGVQVIFGNIANSLFANNYVLQTTQATAEPINPNTTGYNLFLNNIFQAEASFIQGPGSDDVYAYNLIRDAYNNIVGGTAQYYVNNSVSNHSNGYSKTLVEGNEMGDWEDDNIHGTSNLNTFFRNIFYGTDPPYDVAYSHGWGILLDGVARFENVIGNVIGNPNITQYKCTASTGCSPWESIVSVGTGASGIKDTLSAQSVYLWGNYDTVTGAVRWCGNSSDPGWSMTCASTSEVPTSLAGNAAPYANPVPSTQALPASFFIPVTAHPNGGTGLSWWKVCTDYPTCSTGTTVPFPPAGPDVTGGNVDSTPGFPNYQGHANHIPAYVAWKNLPIDPAYQQSFSITGSTWSSGTETLTLSGLPTAKSMAGEFRITGTAGCNGTFLMTKSTGTTFSYALASSSGSCAGGSALFPDVRQFNEKVYQPDP